MWLRVELATTWEVANACCKKVSAIRAFDGSYSAYKRFASEGLPRFSVQTLHGLPLYRYIEASLDIHRIRSAACSQGNLVSFDRFEEDLVFSIILTSLNKQPARLDQPWYGWTKFTTPLLLTSGGRCPSASGWRSFKPWHPWPGASPNFTEENVSCSTCGAALPSRRFDMLHSFWQTIQ